MIDYLKSYHWPGNVRQLKNVTEQISVISSERVITPQILSKYIPTDTESTQLATIDGTGGEHSFENEREILYKILFELRGNVNDLRRDMTMLKKQLGEAQPSAAPIVPIKRDDQDPAEPKPQTPALTPQPIYIQPEMEKQAIAEDAEVEEIAEMENLNLNAIGKQMLEKALERNGGNREKAAKELGISARTLYRRIRQYGLG